MRFSIAMVLGTLGAFGLGTGAVAQIAPPTQRTLPPVTNMTMAPNLVGPSVDLTVTINGSGYVDAVTVKCDAKGSQTSKVCSRPVAKDKAITLTATPGDGMKFVGWAGACSGNAPSCTLTPAKATTVAATFIAAATGTRTLTVKATEGVMLKLTMELTPDMTYLCTPQGNPPGQQSWISTCTAVVPAGTTLTLKGTWGVGMSGLGQFKLKPEEWNTGCDAITNNGCMVVMNEDRSLLITRK